MNNIQKTAWTGAFAFLLFEGLLWFQGAKTLYALKYMIEFDKPFIQFGEGSAVFHSWSEAIISIFFLFLSMWALKQFIEILILGIKAELKG